MIDRSLLKLAFLCALIASGCAADPGESAPTDTGETIVEDAPDVGASEPDSAIEPDPGVCTPDCSTAKCGPDGCGGQCGECGPITECVDGQCVRPEPVYTCEFVIEKCLPPGVLPVTPEAACGLLGTAPDCEVLLLQAYKDSGCDSECGGLPIPGMEQACVAEECIPMLEIIASFTPIDPCSGCP